MTGTQTSTACTFIETCTVLLVTSYQSLPFYMCMCPECPSEKLMDSAFWSYTRNTFTLWLKLSSNRAKAKLRTLPPLQPKFSSFSKIISENLAILPMLTTLPEGHRATSPPLPYPRNFCIGPCRVEPYYIWSKLQCVLFRYACKTNISPLQQNVTFGSQPTSHTTQRGYFCYILGALGVLGSDVLHRKRSTCFNLSFLQRQDLCIRCSCWIAK